jgi:hypothetical protein
MELHDFTDYFVAYDMLFLEKSLGTHFCQFRFPKVRPAVVQLQKNYLDSMSRRQSSQGFTFATTYASAVTGVAAIMVH